VLAGGYPLGSLCGCGSHDRKGMVIVSNLDLISVSESANTAFDGFDWAEHDGKGVRLFVQGFG